ncbi:PHP domain-containing protein [Halosquirtibacter laminarini]|uniref:PHP domain-containing protein n=1 Tax=Halosquirtibacter laminarini TaxID=3374600 RepID=A0AC61NPB6_9BACT|nr:PHP domain-containing protein [Prolixibacteraceae bacterium]
MKFTGDLHIHTTLSPCAELEMTPVNILEKAKRLHWDFIAITDHNDTLQAKVIERLGHKYGVKVFLGAEICTKEEIHVLAIVKGKKESMTLQKYLETYRMKVPNNPCYFGDQVVVDENNNILYEESDLLLTSLNRNIYEVSEFIHQIDGLLIAAHVDREAYSLRSTFGFVPQDLNLDAVEFAKFKPTIERELPWIHNSDAHRLESLKANRTCYYMEQLNFENLKNCFKHRDIEIL